MREIWVGLILAAIFSVTLALTRNWWLKPETREAWHQSWLASRPGGAESAASIQAEHERLLAQMEKEYGEKIAREKSINAKFRSELERLRKDVKTP